MMIDLLSRAVRISYFIIFIKYYIYSDQKVDATLIINKLEKQVFYNTLQYL